MKAGCHLARLAIAGAAAWAQTPAAMTLAQAQEFALRNHPRIASATMTAQAVGFAVQQARAAYSPTLSASLTGVGTEHNSVLSAGAVTTSSIFNRASSGLSLSQLVSDFGRTSNLIESKKLQNRSQLQAVSATRAQVLLEVRGAYYQVLASESVLKVARATLDVRRLTLRQVSALARSGLRSTLDVSFAQVNVSRAELDVYHAESAVRQEHARLSAAMGYERDPAFTLVDEPLPAALPSDVDGLIAEAVRERPDLAAIRLDKDALDRFAEAEKKLRNPTIAALAVAGVAPVRDDRLPETYSAAGINVNIPILNGGLFKARREEAESRAAAAAKDVENLAVGIARDVRLAWLDANDAFERLDLTARLVAEAREALRLAQARYDNALGSIVELSQAQLNETSAEIGAAAAKYDYLIRRAALDYTIGAVK